MNKEFNNEEMMDSIFKQGLEAAKSPVPQGMWEGISSGIGNTTAAAAGSASASGAMGTTGMAVWVKASIGIAIAGAISTIAYLSVPSKDTSVPIVESKPPVQEQLQIIPEDKSKEPIEIKEEANPHNTNQSNTSEPGKEKTESGTTNPAQDPGNKPNPQVSKPNTGSMKQDKPQPLHFALPEIPKADIPTKENSDMTDEEVSNAKGNDTNNVKVVYEHKEPHIFNALTPDGNGQNDTLTIEVENVDEVLVQVRDLNGGLLYETHNLRGWDGTMPNGTEAPAGSLYIVTVRYKVKGESEYRYKHERLTIVR